MAMKLPLDHEVSVKLTVWQIVRILDAIERPVTLHPSEVMIIAERLRASYEKAEKEV